MRFIALVLMLLSRVAWAEASPEDLVSVRVTHDGPLERGRSSPVSIVVTPAAGLTLLEEGPLVLEVVGTGVEPQKKSLRRSDAVDSRAQMPRFELAVKPHKEGAAQLAVALTAWLCRVRRCRPVSYQATLPLVVRN